MSFSPLNLYTFAAGRGQFLRPDVQALLRNAAVGLYSDFANPHDPALRREAEALRKQLDALLFGEPSRPARTDRPPLMIVRRLPQPRLPLHTRGALRDAATDTAVTTISAM